MWIIECDGDHFQHKKTWLKPGQQYLFGRTKAEDVMPGERSYTITHKSVSRKHLLISVSRLAPGEGCQVHARSTVTITDESKIGTYLDGAKFVKESRTLTGHKHDIKLGSFDQHFRLTWRPVVLTLQISEKQQRNTADPLGPYRERFEQFDIKTIKPYIIQGTTHVVSSRRNTPNGLQALINGKYIVTEAFLDALEDVASSPGLADDGNTPLPSKLEQDFEGNWPDAMKYVPDPGKEPNRKPAELFAPNEARISVFEGYTFVFADEAQFEILQPIVNNAGAKAVHFDLKPGQTTLNEFVQFVKSVADSKGLKKFGDNDQAKGVVIVRFLVKGDAQEWARVFMQDIDLELDQRSILQNELLDAILTLNPSDLRKTLQFEDADGTRAPPSTAVTTRPPMSQAPEPEMAEGDDEYPSTSELPKAPVLAIKAGRARRQITQSRFKGFDDFDISQVKSLRRNATDSPIDEEGDEEEVGNRQQMSRSRTEHESAMEVESQSLFVADSQSRSQNANGISQTSRKRRLSPSHDNNGRDDAAAMVDALLPAAAAMKKRRLEDEAAGRSTSTSVREQSVDVPLDNARSKTSKRLPVKPEVDVREAARSNAKALDAQRDKRDRDTQGDDERHDLSDEEDIAKLRDLVIIEEMEVPARQGIRRLPANGDEQRWDDRWNGRKNFKKFKKSTHRHDRTDGDGAVIINNHARKVIVPLEEVKKKDYGIGDEYWLESTTPASKGTTKSNGKRRKDGTQTRSETKTETQTTRRQSDAHGHTTAEDDILATDSGGRSRAVSAVPASRDTNDRAHDSEAGTATASTSTRGKRAAPAAGLREPPPSKRLKQNRIGAGATRAGAVDEDSSDDELKFRFRRQR